MKIIKSDNFALLPTYFRLRKILVGKQKMAWPDNYLYVFR